MKFIIIAVFIIVIVVLFYFNGKAVVKRKLKNAPLQNLADFKDGDVAKIVGRVEFVEEPLEAPLSGRKCAWYQTHVQRRESNEESESWHTLIKEHQWVRFVIRQGDRVAYLSDDNIKSYIVDDVKYKSGFSNDATPRLEAYLNRHGYHSQTWMGFNKTIRYFEGALEKDEAVAVLGKGHWRNAETLGLPRHYGQVLVITAPGDDPIYMSDDHETVSLHRNR